MTGWLIVNEYLNTQKFRELNELFISAGKIKGIPIHVHTNAEFIVGCDGGELVVMSKAFEEEMPDFIIYYDKDIELARALEAMGIPVFNSAEAIEICDSKVKTSLALTGYVSEDEEDDFDSIDNEVIEHICSPKTFKVPFTYENIGIDKTSSFEFLDMVEEEIGYPMIIKESFSSFGMGVHMAKSREEAVSIISEYGNKECIIQEYIKSDGGAKDVRLQMVGDRCVAAMMRSNDNDYRANITNGGSMSEYEPEQADIELAVRVMKALGLDFAGIDIMHKLAADVRRPVFLEANSNAHFKNLYDLTGINTAEYMLDYICEKIGG